MVKSQFKNQIKFFELTMEKITFLQFLEISCLGKESSIILLVLISFNKIGLQRERIGTFLRLLEHSYSWTGFQKIIKEKVSIWGDGYLEEEWNLGTSWFA